MYNAENLKVADAPELKLLRGDDVAKILNVSRAFAFQLMRRGEIPTIRLGRAVRVRRQDLDNFIAKNVNGKTIY
jgi:excisionase family DNA binding protein